jgi:hypothetical protein
LGMQVDPEAVHSYVYSDEMVALVKAANETASFLEDLKGKEVAGFLSEAPIFLVSVYTAMLESGETDPVFEEGTEQVVSEQEWAEVYQQLAEILGAGNAFLRPAEEDEFDRSELVTQTISEDLADIYQELRDFTTNYSRGMEEIMNDAAWELRERFYEHWGKKLLRVLLAIHNLRVTRIDPIKE